MEVEEGFSDGGAGMDAYPDTPPAEVKLLMSLWVVIAHASMCPATDSLMGTPSNAAATLNFGTTTPPALFPRRW